MQVNPAAERSITSASRRAQIVAATIEVIAEDGYRSASFAGIAERAGLSSTRLISYHFAGKADLIAAVVDDVVAAIGRCVGERVAAEATAAGQLRAYVEGVVSFTATHRAQMRALLQILLSGALPAGSAGTDVAVPSHLEALLRRGQAAGEFRDFDPRVMALAVQRSVESLPFALESDPDLDCAAFARELVTLFELATRRAPA
jgi:AcrR family transcriptional regulator